MSHASSPFLRAAGFALGLATILQIGPSLLHAAQQATLNDASSSDTTQPSQAALSVFHISVKPPAEVNHYMMEQLEEACIEELPALLAELGDDPAHAEPYEAHLHVLSVEPIAEHLDMTTTVRATIQRTYHTILNGIRFWAHPSLHPPHPQFHVVKPPLVPDLKLGPYPEDPRVPIEAFHKRGERYVCNVEIFFDDHVPHSFEFQLEQVSAASYHRTAQWGTYPDGRSVTRVLRGPIRWSLAKAPHDSMLTGVSVALEVLRVQLSQHTDRQKHQLFKRHDEKHGRRDMRKLYRSLSLLDKAENAVTITIGRIWLLALMRYGYEPGRSHIRTTMNLGAPGVAELLAAYPPTQAGAMALIDLYTTDSMAIVTKLAPVLDPME